MNAKAFEIKFLDMIIQNTGNGDGITLIGKDGLSNNCSIGNFSNLKTAKIWAVRWFLIQHPSVFGHQVWERMDDRMASGCSYEWFKFQEFCGKLGLVIPDDVCESNDYNFLITCCGEVV